MTDTDLLSSSAARVADSEVVSARVQSWFDRLLIDAGVGEEAAGAAGSLIMAVPEVRSATAEVVGEIVEAAAEPSSGTVAVDVAGTYRSAVPAVTSVLVSAGVPVNEEQVGAMVEQMDPLLLRTEEGPAVVGPGSGTARSLTIATSAAFFTMMASGGWAMMLSQDRRAMLRTLLNRLAVSAFTFAVLFRLSSWVLDPGGGRATIRGGIAQVVGAKLWVPLMVMAVAAGASWAIRHRGEIAEYVRFPARN